MSRWGKPTKNTKHRDPRYFLNENVELDEQAAGPRYLPEPGGPDEETEEEKQEHQRILRRNHHRYLTGALPEVLALCWDIPPDQIPSSFLQEKLDDSKVKRLTAALADALYKA